MPVDQQRYADLIARAAFNAEFFRGTYQDLSSNRLVMAPNATPTFTRMNGLPSLTAIDASDVRSAAIPQVVDITASFSVEVVGSTPGRLPDWIAQSTNGGFRFGQPTGVLTRWEMYMLDNAGAAARLLAAPWSATTDSNRNIHLLMSSINGGIAGSAWFNGTPVVVTPSLVGVVANTPGAVLSCIASRTGNALLVRLYPFALTNPDAQCLSEAAKLLVGGW